MLRILAPEYKALMLEICCRWNVSYLYQPHDSDGVNSKQLQIRNKQKSALPWQAMPYVERKAQLEGLRQRGSNGYATSLEFCSICFPLHHFHNNLQVYICIYIPICVYIYIYAYIFTQIHWSNRVAESLERRLTVWKITGESNP